MPTGPTRDELTALTDEQRQAWSAVRARLVIEHPWLASATFRATPVSAPAGTSSSSDRWGRVYLDFTLEDRAGIASLTDAARAALLNWLAGAAPAEPWHAPRLDERFPAVGAAETDRAARQAAHGIAGTPPPRFGTDPLAGWRPWAQRLASPPQISWRDQLGGPLRGALAAAAGPGARTFTRLGRRQLPGIVTGAQRSPELSVTVVADISGSIAADLPTVVAEVGHIATAAGVRPDAVTVLAVDDEVAAVHRAPVAPGALAPRPGHATDLRPGFAAALSGPHLPSVVVALTDGLTEWPDRALPVPVIVALIGDGTVLTHAAESVPDWARTLRIDTSDHPLAG